MKKFLIADDSTFMRNVMKNVLTKNGHIVIGEAENGRIALDRFKALLPDVVTLDITMNEMNGLEALKEIIEYDKNAKVIMVSAMGQQSLVNEALMLGAKGFLVKPFNEETVLSAVSKL